MVTCERAYWLLKVTSQDLMILAESLLHYEALLVNIVHAGEYARFILFNQMDTRHLACRSCESVR